MIENNIQTLFVGLKHLVARTISKMLQEDSFYVRPNSYHTEDPFNNIHNNNLKKRREKNKKKSNQKKINQRKNNQRKKKQKQKSRKRNQNRNQRKRIH